MGGTVLWDVDTQVDFVEPGGKLHVASADDHELTDPEISEEPDFESTWPPHCLRGTRGTEKVDETKQLDPLPHATLRRLLETRREILIPKKHYDPFTNPDAEPLLDVLDPDELLLFGVATDICADSPYGRCSGGAVASPSSRMHPAGSTRRGPPPA